MGQYYLAINLDKKEFLSPHDHNNGAKLMEHSYVGNNFLTAVESLLVEGGPWYKTRLVWAGDYMDEGIFIEVAGKKGDLRSLFPKENQNLYSYAYEYYERIKVKETSKEPSRYLINHTKQQVCDIAEVQESAFGKIHPLSLLTSSGNGRGGGDYDDEDNLFVGSWAGDVISVGENFPEGFAEIEPDFFEN